MAGVAQRSVLINGVGTVRAPSIVRANSCRSRPVRPTLSQRAQQTSVQTVRKNLVCRAEAEASVSAAAPDTDASTSSSQEGAAQEPADPRFTATIKKPLGMVVAEAKDGSVFVEEITEGGNADAQGVIKVGDIVRKTSARVLKEGKSGDFEKKGHGEAPQHSTFSIEDSSLHRAHVRRHSMCVGSNTCTSPQTMRSGISGMFGPF